MLQEAPQMPQINFAVIGLLLVVDFALIALMVAAMWRIYTKAGKPGWAAIVPIYNVVVMLEIAGKPMIWLVWLLIPFVNIYFGLALLFAFARKFGKGVGFALGMIFLAPIFYPLLAWGDAQYNPNLA
jgi:hypothetical protein